jgi:hypothetical protein
MPARLRELAEYSGYLYFALLPGGIPKGDAWWASFRKWSEGNLPKYTVSSEDCMGMEYTRETISFYVTRNGTEDGADQYMGFKTRKERDMFLSYCSSAVRVRD